MKRGFVTETHVVVYCDTCGDIYTDRDGGEAACFDSVNQAVSFLTLGAVGIAWSYDGDKVTCDGCHATEHCTREGHTFTTSSWRPVTWPLGGSSRVRACDVCGISENEV